VRRHTGKPTLSKRPFRERVASKPVCVGLGVLAPLMGPVASVDGEPSQATEATVPVQPDRLDRHAIQLVADQTYTLPYGFMLSGGALSPDGKKIVAWDTQSTDPILIGGTSGDVRIASSPRPIAGAAFLGPETIEVVHTDGSVSRLDWRTASSGPVIGVAVRRPIASATRGEDGWWLLADDAAGARAELLLVPASGAGVRSVLRVPLTSDHLFIEADRRQRPRDGPRSPLQRVDHRP